MIVLAVGEATYQGAVACRMRQAASAGGDDDSDDGDGLKGVGKGPGVLQGKLDGLAASITRAGAAAGAGTALLLLARLAVGLLRGECCMEAWDSGVHGRHVLDCLVTGVTVFVVAVPEGLPLAVTIALAYSVRKMMTDRCLVRHLSACETMGSATAVCTDKTGTLTVGRLAAARLVCGGGEYTPTALNGLRALPPPLRAALAHNAVINAAARSTILVDTSTGTVVSSNGSETECALIHLAGALLGDHPASPNVASVGAKPGAGGAVAVIRAAYPVHGGERWTLGFNSDRKRMSTVVRWPPVALSIGARSGEGAGDQAWWWWAEMGNGDERIDASPRGEIWRLFTKGAAEVVLERCSSQLQNNGEIAPLDMRSRQAIEDTILALCDQGLRTLALAHRDLDRPPTWLEGKCSSEEKEEDYETELTFVGLVGLEDPVRPEVPSAVRACARAGVAVRMVTGDAAGTAIAVARRCGILPMDGPFEDDAVMTGSDFRTRCVPASSGGGGGAASASSAEEEMERVWPRLRVLARSTPLDKYALVAGIQESRGERGPQTVAVTGDGTNDAPALRRACVGLAMGRSGTQIAREAADIVLLDDDFASVVRAISWGRCVHDNICRYYSPDIKLAVNLSACVIAVGGAAVLSESPLTAIQLLWVNMIMDSLASLALATESPGPELLRRRPYPRDEPLISRRMMFFILGHAGWQLFLITILIFLVGDVCPPGPTIDVCDGIPTVDLWGDIRSGRPSRFDGAVSYVLQLSGNMSFQTLDWNSTHPDVAWGCPPPFDPLDNTTFSLLTGSDPHDTGIKVPFRTSGYCHKAADAEAAPNQHYTMVFNVFVLLQLVNQFNARKLHGERNIFIGLRGNKSFLIVSAAEFLLQVALVQLPGLNAAVGCTALSLTQWCVCLAIASTELPFNSYLQRAAGFGRCPRLRRRPDRRHRRNGQAGSASEGESALDDEDDDDDDVDGAPLLSLGREG